VRDERLRICSELGVYGSGCMVKIERSVDQGLGFRV
jgi:hypothetical protein